MNSKQDSAPDSARQWQVRAVSGSGAVITFGVTAPHHPKAVLAALDRLPFTSREITVTEVGKPAGDGGYAYTDHQAHASPVTLCRFCGSRGE